MDYKMIINLVILFAVLAVLIAIALFIYELLKKERQIEEKEKETLGDYRKIIRNAHKNAKTLLYESTVTAGNILSGAKATNENIGENLDHVLQGVAAQDIHSIKAVTEQYQKDYVKELQTIKDEMHQSTQEVIQSTRKAYNDQLENFTKELLQDGLTKQEEINRQTAELVKKAENEISEYKKTQLAKIESEVTKVIEKVYKDVLRVSIPPSVHQELIMKSLDEAKKDGMFNL